MGAVLLSPFYVLLNIYLAVRIQHWFATLHSSFNSLWFTIPFFVCYALLALTPLLAAFTRGRLKVLTKKVSNYWLGVLMYLLIFLLLMELGRVILRLLQKRSVLTPLGPSSYRIAAGIAFGATALLSLYGSLHASRIKLTHYDVTVHKDCALPPRPGERGLPLQSRNRSAHTRTFSQDGKDDVLSQEQNFSSHRLRIALVADLHLGYNVSLRHIQEIKDAIQRTQPDLIIYAGDIFDNEFDAVPDPKKAAAILGSLKSTYGSYACWGNHDIEEVILAGFTFNSADSSVSSDPRMNAFLKKAGIRLLEDQTVLIADSFYLCGRLDASCKEKSGKIRLTPSQLTSGLDQEKPILVIDHQPSQLRELSEAGADLILSGHTHDGQIFPGNLTTRIGWMNSCGKLALGKATSIVTSGAGIWGPAMRIGTNSEVVEICVEFRKDPSLI